MAKTNEGRNYDYYLKLVIKEGRNLNKVPAQFRTPELCLAAVKNYGLAFKYVPEERLTAEMLKIAVSQHGWRALKNIPSDRRTAVICREAVLKDASAFKYVPIELRYGEIGLLAIQRYTKNITLLLQYFPNEMVVKAMESYLTQRLNSP